MLHLSGDDEADQLLAAFGGFDRDRFLGLEPYPRYTYRTITARSSLEAELELIGEQGYALDNEELDPGAVCVAGVVRRADGSPVGAISVSAPAARLRPESWPLMGKQVSSWSVHVSTMLQSAEGVAPSTKKRRAT